MNNTIKRVSFFIHNIQHFYCSSEGWWIVFWCILFFGKKFLLLYLILEAHLISFGWC